MGRRGKGEGSIRQRPDGRWEARLRLTGDQRVSVYGATRAEVVDQMAKVAQAARLGVTIADGRETYGAYLARWLDLATAGKSESTRIGYELSIRLHIEPVIGGVRMMDLRPLHIERVYAAMLARGNTYLDVVAVVLRLSLGVAEQQGVIVRNVARLVRRPARGARVEMMCLTLEESRRYQAACRASDDRLAPLCELALHTGLRLGEALALTWRDVDASPKLREPGLAVTRSLAYRWGDPIFRQPKTRSSQRRVQLTPAAMEALRRWRVTQREDQLRAGAAWRTSLLAQRPGHEGERIAFEGLVFSDALGRPLRGQAVRRAHLRLCQQAGLPLVRVHDLRHTFATLMLQANVNPKVVSEMLGHAHVSLTLSLYSHVLPHMQRAAVQRLADLLDPDAGRPDERGDERGDERTS